MSKQRISNHPEVLDYLLNEEILISDRLDKYNEYDNLAFISGPASLYPHFNKLVCENEDYKKAFWTKKEKAIKTIQEKQKMLDYESFVKYLFNEIGTFKNKRLINVTKENYCQEIIIYDITPINEQQAKILECASIEYAKSKKTGIIKKPSRIISTTILFVPFISFETLKQNVQESLRKPYAEKEQVIADYHKQYLEALQETETESTAQTIYRNFKIGKIDSYEGKDYSYYATKGAVLELLEFEKFLEQKRKEKYPKIKNLFLFIEYLHSNIENFNQYNGLIKELKQLDKERNQLKPQNNYKDKQQYDKVQAELESKSKTLQDNTANLIKAKARELNVCNFDNEQNYNFNGVQTEIWQLKNNFNNEDLSEIFKHKKQYIEYRSQTSTFLSLQFFFDELDEITKNLFDYFKDTEQNEYEAFEIKAIPVNSIEEAIQGFKKGQTKFSLPNNLFFNTSQKKLQKNDYDLREEDFELIRKLVTIKIEDLQEYKKVRFSNEKGQQITRESYEWLNIANYLNKNFGVNMIIAYLSVLKNEIKKKNVKIIEYRPVNDYDATKDFLNRIDKQLIDIELKHNLTVTATNKEQQHFKFQNNFDQIEPNKVYEYFFNSLVKTNYIDESTLKSYLISAFQNKQAPKQRITINNKQTNKKVQQIFYNYYKVVAGKPYGKQQSYIELLGNYFVGFDTKKLKTNFSKTY